MRRGSMDQPPSLRIVLLGKTGTGKSSAGNTILGRKFFETDDSPESVTKSCERQEVQIDKRTISVIDTPDLFDMTTSDKELRTEIKKCVYMSAPGPHVFLLLMKVGRFSEEEKNTVKWIQKYFGDEALCQTIILFTHEDQLEGKPLDRFIRKSSALQALIDECGGRFHSFNAKNMKNRSQVAELLQKIEEMVENNGGQHYTIEAYEQAQKKIEWEAFQQKAKDYGKTALTVIGGGTAAAAALGAARGPAAAAAVAAVGAVALIAAAKQRFGL